MGSHLLHRGLTVLVRVVWEGTAPTLRALHHRHLPRNRKSKKKAANGQRRCTISLQTYVLLCHFYLFIYFVDADVSCVQDPTDLSITAGERLLITERNSKDWWTAESDNGQGLIPAAYVKVL